MTAQTTSLHYLSLSPKDTAIWKLTEQSCPLQKAALVIFSIVAVPLEMIARCFYNAGVWIYNNLCHRSIHQANIFQPRFSASVAKAIAAAEQSIPGERLGFQDIRLKVEGTSYGQALGDGLGVFTEFLSCHQAKMLIKDKLEFADRVDFEGPNPHVIRFPRNGWTDDTDQAMMIVRAEKAYLSDPTTSKEARMAEQLYNWRYHGLNDFSGVQGLSFISRQMPSSDPYRNTISCQGLGALTSSVLQQPQFMRNPHEAALEVWKLGDQPISLRKAANGALMRTSMLGSMYRNQLELAVQEAVRYAKVTHADPRSIASAVAMTAAIALLHSGASAENVLHHAEEIAVCILWDEMENVREHLNVADQGHWKEIAEQLEQELRTCMHADLIDLNLEDRQKMGYTFKTLGAGFHALRRAINGSNASKAPQDNFRNSIQEIIWEGGDADTNAAVAGALVGAYLGAAAVPESWRRDLHPQDQAVLQEAIEHCEQVAQKILRK